MSTNALSLKTSEINKLKDGNKLPKYEILPVDKLIVPEYQREPNYNKSEKISQNLDFDLLGIVLISKRNGLFYIIDGMHRVNALKLSNIKHVLCQIIEGLSIEEESSKFLKLNTLRTPLNANQKFFAKLKAKDPIANDIVKILEKHGIQYVTNNGVKEDNRIACLSSCEYAYKRLGTEQFNNLFDVIKKAWNNRAASLHVQIVRGLSTFLNTHGEYYNIDILISALKESDPSFVIKEASAIAGNKSNLSDSPCLPIAKIIWNKYNKKAKELGKKEIPYMF